MDHHLAETRSAMLKEAYSKGYIAGFKDMVEYMRHSNEQHIKELEKGNPFKWVGDFLRRKFNKGNSPETVAPDHQGVLEQ